MKVLIMAGLNKSLTGFRGDLIREMVARGHDVVACAPEDDADGSVAALGIRYLPVVFRRTGTNPFAELQLMRAYRRLMKQEKPDVVFCYTIKPNVYGPPAAKSAGVKRVYIMVTGLGNTFIPDGTLKNRVMRFISKALYRRAAKRCNRIIFQNPDDRALFEQMKLVRPDQTETVNGSGVNTQHYLPSSLPVMPTFLLVGRMLREKGIMEYLEACRIVRQSGVQAVCSLLGPFESNVNAITEAMIQPYIDDGSIEYWGVTWDVRPQLAECSIYVLPSYREGTPRSVLEAMSCGRAVITTDAPGCRETVLPGKTGLLVPPKDPAALAEAMLRLAQDPKTVAEMGRAGRDYCLEKYDVRLVNRRMLEILGL